MCVEVFTDKYLRVVMYTFSCERVCVHVRTCVCEYTFVCVCVCAGVDIVCYSKE